MAGIGYMNKTLVKYVNEKFLYLKEIYVLKILWLGLLKNIYIWKEFYWIGKSAGQLLKKVWELVWFFLLDKENLKCAPSFIPPSHSSEPVL